MRIDIPHNHIHSAFPQLRRLTQHRIRLADSWRRADKQLENTRLASEQIAGRALTIRPDIILSPIQASSPALSESLSVHRPVRLTIAMLSCITLTIGSPQIPNTRP